MVNFLLASYFEYEVNQVVDDTLIMKIATGDTDALRQLYENVSGNIYGFALSITKNTHDAEDVLQETFVKVYSKACEYIPQGKPLAWIFTIARNLCLTKMREKARTSALDESRPQDLDFSSVHDVEHKILLEMLFKVLNDEEKQILLLHSVNGMKHREIASFMNISLNTALSKYHRAIKKLKAAVKEGEK